MIFIFILFERINIFIYLPFEIVVYFLLDRVPFLKGFFLRGFTEGTVTARVLSSRKRREKEDRIGASQPF
jgi:hypothetical protein